MLRLRRHPPLLADSGMTVPALARMLADSTAASQATMLAGAQTVGAVWTFQAPVRLKGYTVAGLPAGTVGDTAYVTNALLPAWGVAVAGGGAVVVPVFYNGVAWVVG